MTLKQLSQNSTAVLTATVKRTQVTSQKKTLNECNKIIINRSQKTGSGTGLLGDGLTSSNVYGTRVQDKEICLNFPDIVRVLAVFESSTTGDPNLPSISLINRSADLTNTINGELVVGENSGATARVVTKAAGSVDIVYTNDIQFEKEEIVTFQSSGIVGEVSLVVQGDKDITKSFRFDNGQRQNFMTMEELSEKKVKVNLQKD